MVLDCDVLVIGSGVSGYCAAIQAGREGCDTILLEKDEVLGGNSGPNCGVLPRGAQWYNEFGAETGLIYEIEEEIGRVQAQTQVSPGTMVYSISRRAEAVIHDFLRSAGVRVLKRHYARAPVITGDRITAVLAEDLAAFRTVRINIRHVVIEASGDGHIGAQAGADFDIGTESRDEFGERSAPAERSHWVQGTSLVAIAQKTDHEVDFVPPDGTPAYSPRLWQGKVPAFIEQGIRNFGDGKSLMFLYVTEAGGDRDTIADDGDIYEALLGQMWAYWDHVKNGPGREAARDWDLLWVSPKAGKRESRRFLGDYILTQTDLEEGRTFDDDIAYGGHDLDDHIPEGECGNIFAHSLTPMYGVPFRCCYSRNVDNLLLAGRLISATHLAHSSSRIMLTGAAIGQAVGSAAGICLRRTCSPRTLHAQHMTELQSNLLNADATLLRRPLPAEGDLARHAAVSATSELRFSDQEPAEWRRLDAPAGNVLWDWPRQLETVAVCLRNASSADQELTLGVYRADRHTKWKSLAAFSEHGRNDLGDGTMQMLSEQVTVVPAGHEGWLPIPLSRPLALDEKDAACDDDRLLITVGANPEVEWAQARRAPEIARLAARSAGGDGFACLDGMGTMRLTPAPAVGDAASVIDGFSRRFTRGPTHMWMSDPEAGFPQELTLAWEQPILFDEVRLTFDNLEASPHDNPWEHRKRASEFLVRDYELLAGTSGAFTPLVRAEDNYHRVQTHRFPETRADALRLRVLACHGEGYGARVYSVGVHHGCSARGDKT